MKPVVDAIDNKQFIAAEELISAALQEKINNAMVERKHEVANIFGQNIDEEKKDYEAFFEKAMKKFGISSPADLKTDEKKKEFFNYVDKNFKATNEEFELSEEAGGGQNASDIMKYRGTLEAIGNYTGLPNPGQMILDRLDFNGDGVIDEADAAIVQQILDDGELPFMGQPIAANYRKYMASDARSGRKQQQGAAIQFGTTRGSGTSRPPAAPPTTGTSMK